MSRWRRHRIFTFEDEQKIVLAIRHAERQTSGEIRVHVQPFLKADVLTDAVNAFHRLKMDKTQERNAVIFFLIPKKRLFAVYGDEGITAKVGAGFWDEVKQLMQEHFRRGEITEGLVKAIQLTGEKLKHYFPRKSDDENELPDEISYD